MVAGVFSERAGWSTRPNRLATALDARRRGGAPLLDLTVTNPTRVGLPWPGDAIGAALAAGAAEPYDPDPRGDVRARGAIAAAYAARGLAVDPDRIVLTASTSEGYAWLFKLLCDPGARVLVPRPSYPLFEFLATLESVEASAYPLRFDGRWEIDGEALERTLGDPGGAAAIVAVHPNNPTGSRLTPDERALLEDHAARQGAALISDEVFAPYPLDAGPTASLLGRDAVPAFVLDGLSKSAGLPGMKLGWIVVQGPAAFRDQALARLEVVADTYLSVGQPAQRALPRLIEIGAGIAGDIRERTRRNAATLRAACPAGSRCEALPVEGGWSAVVRVPHTRTEEDWCLALLEQDGVVVQPGFFFDFESEAFLVVSLLVDEGAFAEGIARVVARAAA
jgi:hypothetical protein